MAEACIESGLAIGKDEKMGQEFTQRLFSVGELYIILVNGMRYFKYKKDSLPDAFKERIMLAVTEVNNCEMCSYHHTKLALETGMDSGEIKNMLSGDFSGVPDQELPAIMFAQHYAFMRGKPDESSWAKLVEVYGENKAERILAAIRTIMVGNAYGIVMGSLKKRGKGGGDKRSSLIYEIIVLVTLFPFVPLAFLNAIVLNVLKIPAISFK